MVTTQPTQATHTPRAPAAALLASLFLVGCATDAPPPTDRPAQLRRVIDAGESRDPAQIPWLVEQLDHDDPAMRMLTAQALKRITGQTLGYQPYAPRHDRRPALERWQAYALSAPPRTDTLQPTPP
jgi:hypothetical protein